jgi:hypothetical protein
MELVVMGVVKTLSATLTDWFLPSDHLVFLYFLETVQTNGLECLLRQIVIGENTPIGLYILKQVYQRKLFFFSS